MGWWLTLPAGRFVLRLHLGIALLAAVLSGTGWALGKRYLLLVCTLLLHELAHALAALVLGARRAEVRIWPVFGRADVERFPDAREAIVALAAPLANLAVAAALYWGTGARFTLQLARGPWLDFLFTINLAMGVANLIPVPPIDGGRALAAVVRALRGNR